ncbi:hypothetical protein HDU99_006964 [Rhizoclosmatium hyalinum]|nr:hypothetical protein HDU99_006964 [Rhizoclosmatium hyalinum]
MDVDNNVLDFDLDMDAQSYTEADGNLNVESNDHQMDGDSFHDEIDAALHDNFPMIRNSKPVLSWTQQRSNWIVEFAAIVWWRRTIVSHATRHSWNTYCHKILDIDDKPPPSPRTTYGGVKSKAIRCCGNPTQRTRRLQLHAFKTSETVLLVTCSEHQNGQYLCSRLVRDFGFFPSRVTDTDHAFSEQLLEYGLESRQLGVSFQTSAELFFGTDFKDAKGTGCYQPFMDATRQLAIVMLRKKHGIFSEEIMEELGLCKTECPACIGGDNVKGPAAFTMDGFDSANKKSKERGGGGSHGKFDVTDTYFQQPTVRDVVQEAKEKTGKAKVSPGCESNHKAGGESTSGSSGKDIDRIVHVDCAAHAIVHRVYDVKGGERLLYADDTIKWGTKNFMSRGFILGYDVACKELAHLIYYNLLRPILNIMLLILFIPAMHVYAHGKDCQALFGPRILMGLGLTMDGEGHERVNSWLARMIGLTLLETDENRRLDIVLNFEFYNWMKVRKLVSWTEDVLAATFARLAELKEALGSNWRAVEDAVYVAVVERVTSERQRVVEKEVPVGAETLRTQINHLVRGIVSIDKHLHRGPGTKMAQRLKKSLASSFVQVYKKLAEFNEMDPKPAIPLTFASVKDELILHSVDVSNSDLDELVTLYFRLCEDLFHHRNYLHNFIGYYEKRRSGHWSVVTDKVESLRDVRAKAALHQVAQRRLNVEDEYCRQAKEVLSFFEENEENAGLYFQKHLDEIGAAFSSRNSVLSRQNIRNSQNV